jgi:hypothetical protein
VEAGHRLSKNTTVQSLPYPHSACAQEGTGPQLERSTTELQVNLPPGSGTHMSSVHRRLSLQRAVLGE